MSISMEEFVAGLLNGMDAKSFGPDAWGMRVLCTQDIRPPVGWEKRWYHLDLDSTLSDEPWLQESELLNTSVLLVVADLAHCAQKSSVEKLGVYLCENAHSAPPTLLVPVVCPRSPMALTPEAAAAAGHVREHAQQLLKDSSVDDIVWAPADGFTFALAVQAKLRSLTERLGQYEDEMARRTANTYSRDLMSSAVHHTRWEYLRTRMFQAIPPMRSGIADHGRRVGAFQLGGAVMRSPFGVVYAASVVAPRRADREQAQPDVALTSMLVVEKIHVRHLSSMKMISCSLHAMDALRNVRHPNLPRLIDAFQTSKRLCVQMEYLGDCTLFSRLKRRDASNASGAQRRPLSSEFLLSLMSQISAAVCHLHEVVLIAHRDLKPEHVLIREIASEPGSDASTARIEAKIGGFELATSERRSQLPCGTMPFAAPEVILAGKGWYSCMAADVWSLGVLFMELNCGLKSMNPHIPQEGKQTSGAGTLLGEKCPEPPSHRVAHKIQELFGEASFVPKFFENIVPEAVGFKEWLPKLVSKMVQVKPDNRIAAAELQELIPRYL